MAEIAFIGLGIMGRPMAANLVKQGHVVRGFSRNPETRAAAAALGVAAVESIAEAVDSAEVVITMLPDSPDVREVALGEEGVLARIAAGALFIDMSTIDPDVAREVAARCADAGVGCLDAPVSGGEAAAIEGTLSVMAGGEPEAFERAMPILSAMAATITHVGPAGSGQVVKAANQLMVAGHLQVLAEALVFLQRQGVDAEVALTAIAGGLAGSTVLQRKGPAMLSGSFAPGFRLALHHKDLGIVRKAAEDTALTLPVTALVAESVRALVEQGSGGLDHSALYTWVSSLNAAD